MLSRGLDMALTKYKLGDLIEPRDVRNFDNLLTLDNLKGIESISILGATGGRADHTIGNASLLMEYTRMFDLKDIKIESISDEGTIFPITDSIEFDCGVGREVSIFTPDSSLRICSEGLMYQTDDVVFDNWWKATLNKSISDTVRLTLSHKSIALIMLD